MILNEMLVVKAKELLPKTRGLTGEGRYVLYIFFWDFKNSVIEGQLIYKKTAHILNVQFDVLTCVHLSRK